MTCTVGEIKKDMNKEQLLEVYKGGNDMAVVDRSEEVDLERLDNANEDEKSVDQVSVLVLSFKLFINTFLELLSCVSGCHWGADRYIESMIAYKVLA